MIMKPKSFQSQSWKLHSTLILVQTNGKLMIWSPFLIFPIKGRGIIPVFLRLVNESFSFVWSSHKRTWTDFWCPSSLDLDDLRSRSFRSSNWQWANRFPNPLNIPPCFFRSSTWCKSIVKSTEKRHRYKSRETSPDWSAKSHYIRKLSNELQQNKTNQTSGRYRETSSKKNNNHHHNKNQDINHPKNQRE